MFIIYMVIGFTATLACIMILTLLYFLVRQAPTFAYLCGQPFLQACTDPKNGPLSTAAACLRLGGRRDMSGFSVYLSACIGPQCTA